LATSSSDGWPELAGLDLGARWSIGPSGRQTTYAAHVKDGRQPRPPDLGQPSHGRRWSPAGGPAAGNRGCSYRDGAHGGGARAAYPATTDGNCCGCELSRVGTGEEEGSSAGGGTGRDWTPIDDGGEGITIDLAGRTGCTVLTSLDTCRVEKGCSRIPLITMLHLMLSISWLCFLGN
jgi:hypothetical protein